MILKYMIQLISKYNPNEGLEAITNKLYHSSDDITKFVTNYFKYQLDGDHRPLPGKGITYIENGGDNMYQNGGGNNVYTRAGDSDWHPVVYGETYTGNPGYDVSSIMSHPFVTLMHIENAGGIEATFDIKVTSKVRARYTGIYDSDGGELKRGGFTMKYKTYNVHTSSDRASITEVYFVVHNVKLWKSVISERADFFKPIKWSSGTKNLENIVRVNGSPRNILFGYTLFSRSDAKRPQVQEAMMIMLRKISEFDPRNGVGCSRLEESAVTPVQFHTGSPQDLANSIPPTQRLDTTAGYLQFRAVSPEGLPFAMCPGVKTESCSPSTVCIGGINSLKENAEACGDFTGYAGFPGDKPTETEPDGSAHSLKDIDSSILIFTRDSNTVSTKTSGY